MFSHDLPALATRVSYPPGPLAYDDLGELGRGHREEGGIGFARDRAREQRFASSRRPDQKNAARDALSHVGETLGRCEEIR